MLNADPSKVSMRAKKRGLPQVRYDISQAEKLYRSSIIIIVMCISLVRYTRGWKSLCRNSGSGGNL